MLLTTNGGTVVTQGYVGDPTNPLLTYVGNQVQFEAVVTGVPASDIQVIQVINTASAPNQSGQQTVYAQNVLDGGSPLYNGGPNWNGGNGISTGGVTLNPSVTPNPNDGSVELDFYDGPGQADDASTLGSPRVNSGTYTTYIIQTSTGQVLAQQSWSTSSTLNPNGTGTSTFQLGSFGAGGAYKGP